MAEGFGLGGGRGIPNPHLPLSPYPQQLPQPHLPPLLRQIPLPPHLLRQQFHPRPSLRLLFDQLLSDGLAEEVLFGLFEFF